MNDDTQRPDVRDMVLIHNGFRGFYSELPTLFRGATPGDRGRADFLVDHLFVGIDVLHEHHTAEDLRLWPVLHKEAAVDKDLLQRMESQHQAIAPLLERARTQANLYRSSAQQADAETLAATLEEVNALLFEHLQEEESRILPLCEQFMTVDEWKRLPGEGGPDVPMKHMMIFMGAIEENNTPEDMTFLLHDMPVVLRKVLAPFVLRPQYRRYSKKLRQGA